ncbi:PHD finger protein 21Aa isoform X7 [Astyanax mexicanus]|uniref:PHD finger protein 21Aa isoform X7 n=1 Tax=Astyanax mexicanus TaxID=7994 RepID=UPI000440E4DB|nr:PHD finger protein 21Aa isoform X7 [Astyanax mexicanus]
MVFKTADVVKAEGGVGFGQKGLMMELQSLQEALKVEIQIHQKLVAQMKQDPQNAELKLQLHDLQAKITALSERQKKVVEQLRRDLLVKQETAEIRLQTQTQLPLQAEGKTTTLVSSQSQSLPPPHLSAPQNSVSVTPVIATKTLPLVLRAATPTTPIAMMPTPTIAMVTTLTNASLPSLSNSDPQNSPISLQMSTKPSNQGTEPVRIVPKSTIVVMPKPPASVTPAALQPILASPQSLQQPVLLAAKLSSALLPTSGPVHQLHIFSPQPSPAVSQPCSNNAQPIQNIAQTTITQTTINQPCLSSVQPSPNIIQSCPSITMTLNTNLGQFNTSGTLHNTTQLPSILISSQPSQSHVAFSGKPSSNSTSTDLYHGARSSKPCPETLTLVAVDGLEPKTSIKSPVPCPAKLQSPAPTSSVSTPRTQTHTPTPAASHTPTPKRQENPLKLAFMVSLGLVTHDYLEEIQSKRQERKRRTTANPVYSGAVFEPECKKSTVSYLTSANQVCRKRANEDSLSEILKKDEAIEWPGTLAIVHSYISYKAEREQEKQKLEKWSSELQQEREELQLRVKQLSDSITICMESRSGVLARQREMETSINKVKGLVRLIRGIQLPSLTQPEISSPGLANGDPSPASVPQPEIPQACEEDQHPTLKSDMTDSVLVVVSSASADLSDTSNLKISLNNSNATNINSSISSPGNTNLPTGINTSTSCCASGANNSALLSNTHNQKARSNGPLDHEDGNEHEESIKKSADNNDVNKNSNGDINKNSIRDLSAVMPMAEVIQGVE